MFRRSFFAALTGFSSLLFGRKADNIVDDEGYHRLITGHTNSPGSYPAAVIETYFNPNSNSPFKKIIIYDKECYIHYYDAGWELHREDGPASITRFLDGHIRESYCMHGLITDQKFIKQS